MGTFYCPKNMFSLFTCNETWFHKTWFHLNPVALQMDFMPIFTRNWKCDVLWLSKFWGQTVHQTIPEKLIVSDFPFFRILIVQFILGWYFTFPFWGGREILANLCSWKQHVIRAWVPKHVVQREKYILSWVYLSKIEVWEKRSITISWDFVSNIAVDPTIKIPNSCFY